MTPPCAPAARPRRFRPVLLLLPLALLYALCPGLALAAADGGLRGLVFAESSGLPWPQVQVSVLGQQLSATTDGDGAFAFWLPAGRYRLRLQPPAPAPAVELAVTVLAGEESELLITLSPAGPPRVDQDRPGPTTTRQPCQAGAHEARCAPLAQGTVRGQILGLEGKKPVPGARVFVRGAQAEAQSDAAGRFTLRLPVGRHDLSLVHPQFSTQAVPQVEVQVAAVAELTIELSPAALTLEAFTVSAPRISGSTSSLLQERQTSAAVTDVLGAEQMARSGDSDAAGALIRVTGITLVDGKYVYVRGLGDRYASAMLNGASLPSPEPERRVIPLDVFPVKLLESVVIPKTYTPDLPGEFGGGAILLRTRPLPEERVGQLSVSAGGEIGTTFSQGLSYAGGRWDWLGLDDGTRALPAPVRRASDNSPLKERDRFSQSGYTPEELERFGEQLSRTWATRRQLLPPDFGLAVTLGDRLKLWQIPLGYLASLTWSSEWQSESQQRTYYLVGAEQALEPAHDYAFETTENEIRLGGILNLGAELAPGQKLEATTVLVRSTSDEARIYEGHNSDVDTRIRVTRLRWVERMLLAQQLRGEHRLGAAPWRLDWRYSYALASRYEPDRREYRFDLEPATGGYLLSDRPEGNQRVFSELADHNHDLGLDLTTPLPWLAASLGSLKLGGNLVFKDREVDTRRFKFLHKGPLSTASEVIGRPPEEIFTPAQIGPDGFQFEEITRETDNYSASQRLYAGYLMADLQPLDGLRLTGGLRLEHSAQRVTTFQLFNPAGQPVVADLTHTDALPALSASYSLTTGSALRLAYARTVSRPEFRELSPATFNDVTGGRQIFGNPELKRATLSHVDLRAEWYPSPSEVLSLGAFYKDFTDPIETVVVVSAQHSVTYANALGARNLGLEAELRKWLDFVSPALKNVYLAGNVAWIRSRVELSAASGIQTSNERPLQGQSPFVVNAELGYSDPGAGLHLAALYNVSGRRISEVGALGAPDIYEEPVHVLDLAASVKLGADLTLSGKARNLLDPEVKRTQGGLLTETYRKGRAFSLSLSWDW